MSNRQRILVIDDDVQVVDTVETLLQSVGYETFHAFRTEDGMELARRHFWRSHCGPISCCERSRRCWGRGRR